MIFHKVTWDYVRYRSATRLYQKISCHLSSFARVFGIYSAFSFTVLWQPACSLASFSRVFGNFISKYLSGTHSQMAIDVAAEYYIFQRILSLFYFLIRVLVTWINSWCRVARVGEKGFSCLDENVLRPVTIEMIGKFSSPYPPFPLSSFFFSRSRHSSRIASSRCCVHNKRVDMHIIKS